MNELLPLAIITGKTYHNNNPFHFNFPLFSSIYSKLLYTSCIEE